MVFLKKILNFFKTNIFFKANAAAVADLVRTAKSTEANGVDAALMELARYSLKQNRKKKDFLKKFFEKKLIVVKHNWTCNQHLMALISKYLHNN